MWNWFQKGGIFMWPILLVCIIGLVFVIERLIVLSRAKVNTKKFISRIREALKEGGVEKAMEVCINTRGPLSAIFHSGLTRHKHGIQYVEKAIEEAGAVEMAFLEKGLIWLATVISLAPMLGFLGTVSGMINAFDAIAAAGDVEPVIVASGIAEALITTEAGLCIAIPVQAAYNYFISTIDKLIIDMEESSNALIDALMEMEISK